MSRTVVVSLRLLQALLAVSNLGLSAYVANYYTKDQHRPPPSEVNFLIFAPIFSLVSLAYLDLLPRCMPWSPWSRLEHRLRLVALAAEALNTLFYFSVFIAVAVFLSGLATCTGTVCATARADAVLAAGQFSAWIATFLIMAKDLFKNGMGGTEGMGQQGQHMGEIGTSAPAS